MANNLLVKVLLTKSAFYLHAILFSFGILFLLVT